MVVAEDTDIFLLLLHFKKEGFLGSNSIYMISPNKNSKVAIDIEASVQAHSSIVPNLLAAHALSGCDTTPSYFGIGKAKVLKILRLGRSS